MRDGPPAQQQEWPGTEASMRPPADHGEESYRGHGRLEGRKALVTGGDSGIGRAVAIAFAREGADVCLAYYNEHDDAEETLDWVREAGREGAAFPGDLGDPDHARHVVEDTVQALGGLDLLVNNAGYHCECGVDELTADQIERTFRTNVLSMFWTTLAALPHLDSGSAILNTGSAVGMHGHPTLVDYAATKGAVHVLTKSLARALADRRIRVNCVAPGPVWTPLIPATREPEEIEDFGADTFRDRPAQPAEIAPSFVFLASEASRFVTGEIVGTTGRLETTR